MIEKYISQGKMIFVKKIVGFGLAFGVVNYFYPIYPINEYLHLIFMGLASYFLLVSGRRK